MMDGIFTPKEILKLKDLNYAEKYVLSVYKYFTEKGKNKCCSLTNAQIADELYMSVIYVKQIKSHLKELGYIRTNGGIKVVYVGPKNKAEQDAIAYPNSMPEHTPQDAIAYPNSMPEHTPQDAIAYPNSMPEHTHKEEKEELKKEIKKEKEELNEEEKIARANFKLIIDRIYPPLKSREGIEYLWVTYKDRLSKVDLSGGALDSWVQAFQDILRKKFPIQQVTPKPKTKSDTIDMF